MGQLRNTHTGILSDHKGHFIQEGLGKRESSWYQIYLWGQKNSPPQKNEWSVNCMVYESYFTKAVIKKIGSGIEYSGTNFQRTN